MTLSVFITVITGHDKPQPSGYLLGDDRNAGSALPPAVWFAYSPDRKGIHPQTHLAGFSGVLQADAYAGFNELYRDGRITEAACWASLHYGDDFRLYSAS